MIYRLIKNKLLIKYNEMKIKYKQKEIEKLRETREQKLEQIFRNLHEVTQEYEIDENLSQEKVSELREVTGAYQSVYERLKLDPIETCRFQRAIIRLKNIIGSEVK
ncbi:MAG: hypothetical protein WC584_04330 [Candidatus Pacearchaeota archaeon]